MKHISAILITASALVLLPSCSIFQKNSNTVSGASASQVKQPAAIAPAPAVPASPAATAPTPAATAPATDTVATAPAAAAGVPARDLGGEWLMIQVGAQALDRDEDMPYIIFDKDGRFYANDGCNTLNGSYALSATDEFAFSNMMSTMRYCPDQDIQHTIATVLSPEAKVKAKFTTIGTESFIDLLSPSGKTAVRLRRANIDFLNGHWQVIAINGSSVDPQAPADIFFDIAERKIHGNTGCNYFNGEIYLDYRHPNAIDFSKMGVTRMACPYTTQETALLVALEETASALSGGKDSAMLMAADGRELLTLRRIDDSVTE